jgi:hypothetical protein
VLKTSAAARCYGDSNGAESSGGDEVREQAVKRGVRHGMASERMSPFGRSIEIAVVSLRQNGNG